MKIAFLGDSITFGHGLSDQSRRFSTLVANRLCAEEINLGICGTLVARAGLSRADGSSFVDRFLQTEGADIVVVFGGTNDYFWSDTVIESEENEGEEYFKTALCRMCEAWRERFGETKLLFVTPYTHRGIGNFLGGAHFTDRSEHDTTEKNFNGHTLADYVDTIEAVGARYGVPVLNLHKWDVFSHPLHTSDGCHPNEEGHKLLADVITAFVQKNVSL